MADKQPNIRVTNDALQAYYASFFSVEVSNNDVSLSFGQKLPSSDQKDAEFVVGKRLVLTHSGALLFNDILTKALSKLPVANKNRKKQK